MSGGLIEIEFDKKDLKQLQMTLAAYPRKVPQVMSRAINKTATMQRARIVREIAKVTGVDQKDVAVRVRISRASLTRWVAEINIGNRRIALIRFQARQTPRGVTFQDPVSGQQQTMQSAFIATMLTSGRVGVFVRGGKKRLPIFEQFGPGTADIFTQAESVARLIIAETENVLEQNIGQEVDLVFESGSLRAAS